MKVRTLNLRRIGGWLIGCIPVVLGIVYIIPVIMLAINAVKPLDEIVFNFLALPKKIYVGNIIEAIDILNYWLAFRNTAIITVLTAVGSCVFSFMCAYGTAHLGGKLSGGIYMLFVIGQMVPFHAIMVPVYVMASRLNMTNSFLGMAIFGWAFNVAFGMVMYTGFLKTVPRELEEAAELDGSGILNTMFRVVFPLVGPTTATVGVLFFLGSWNDYLLPSLMLSDVNRRTLMVNIAYFRTTTATRWELMIAGLMIVMVPVIVIYAVAQRYIVSGMTVGAVK